MSHNGTKHGTELLGTMLLYVVLISLAIVMIAPIIWLVAASLKSGQDFFAYPFFPPLEKISLDNFRSLFVEMSGPDRVPFGRLIINSFFISGTTVMIQLFFASLGGFALAKYRFRGKGAMMLLMLGTMMIPPQVMLAPLYEMIARMNLVDSYLGLIIPTSVSVFGMFLFRQSMIQVPDGLLEAGRIDGCSEFGLFWNIALPISRPMVGAFCLIAFMASWNSYLWPQIILHTKERYTLAIGLSQLVGLQRQDYGILMAGTLLSIIPVAILFFVLQREFIRGLTAGAVKG